LFLPPRGGHVREGGGKAERNDDDDDGTKKQTEAERPSETKSRAEQREKRRGCSRGFGTVFTGVETVVRGGKGKGGKFVERTPTTRFFVSSDV